MTSTVQQQTDRTDRSDATWGYASAAFLSALMGYVSYPTNLPATAVCAVTTGAFSYFSYEAARPSKKNANADDAQLKSVVVIV